MGEYEPNDSRNITLSNDTAPGEPPRTGPREGEARAQSHVAGKSEKSESAAPRLNLNGEPLDENGRPIGEEQGQPPANPQASQSQWQGGQSQSMAGMSQSAGGSDQQTQEPSASHRSDARPQQLGDFQPSRSAPTQQEAGSADNAGWAADFPVDQAEAASGHAGQHRQEMPEEDPEAEHTRRQQAAGQGSPDAPQGFGYGAEDGEEMSEAPDASDPSDPSHRGYGGAGEARMEKINKDQRS
jgi:hypothetical protein